MCNVVVLLSLQKDLFIHVSRGTIYNTMNIKIFSDIGEFAPVNFNDIVAQIENMPAGDNEINLLINSHGGECYEAFKIYDVLRESGKEITAHVVGECSSAATLLLLSAPKEKRTANPNATILIHNPYCFDVGDANQFKRTSEELQEITDKFVAIYVERTGANETELTEIMNENKPMGAERAQSLGFINNIKQPITNLSNMSSKIKKCFLALGLALGVMGLSVETADGLTLEFERESGTPETGDKTTAQDGEYLMPSGETFVIKEGVLVEIKPPEPEPEPAPEPEPEPNPEIETLRTEIETLKNENEQLRDELEKQKANAKTKDELEILAAVNVAGGRDWLAKITSGSNQTPKGFNEPNTPQPATAQSYAEYYNSKHNKK